MKTNRLLSALCAFVSVFALNLATCSAQCSWDVTFIDPNAYTPTPISIYVVGGDIFGDEIAALIVNTGNDTVRGLIWYKLSVVDENHQQEIENNYIDISRMNANGYLAPGESIGYWDLISVEQHAQMGFVFPYDICFEIYDSTTTATCASDCLKLTDCDGERVINISRDYLCQNQPYDFFGQQITTGGTYHHYDTTETCILHYILHLSDLFVIPEPSFTISGEASFCEGGETTLTVIANHSSYNNDPGFHLLWSDGTTTPDNHITTGGTWTVTASSLECTASNTVTVTVFPLPEILLEGNLEHCDGTPVELQLATENITEVLWSDGTSGPQFTTDQSGAYTVTVTDENGCVSSSEFDVASGMPSSSTVSATADHYLAFNGHIYTQSGEYTCIIPNATGCDSVITLQLTILHPGGVTIFEDTTCIGTRYRRHAMDTVFELTGDYAFALTPTEALQLHVIDYRPQILCSGILDPCLNETVTLSVDGAADSYHWNNALTTPSITVTQAGYYAVTVSNFFGCVAATDYIQVGHSDQLPNNPEFCMITVVSNNYYTMNWDYNNANVVGYNIYRMVDNQGGYSFAHRIIMYDWTGMDWTDYIYHADQHTNTYRVSAVDACGGESQWSEPITPMHLVISFNSDSSLHLQWNAYDGAEVYYYRIMHDHDLLGTQSGTTADTCFDIPDNIANSHSGYYYIEAVTNLDCTLQHESVDYSRPQSNRVNVETVKIPENAVTPTLNVFPNPTTGVLNVQITNISSPSAFIEIYDLYGRLITRESFTGDLVQINTSSYKSGVYVVRAMKEDGVIGYCKFVKQ